MEYMKIGHTDINASAITFGAMPIGGGTWWSGSDDKVSIDTIHRAYDLGSTPSTPPPFTAWATARKWWARPSPASGTSM